MSTKLAAPLKWHGGKQYLAPKIVAMMPPHTHYVEPFAGGLAVLLAKDPDGVSEVVNDLNRKLINFWGCLQIPDAFSDLSVMLSNVPFSERLWESAAQHLATPCPKEGVCVGCAAAFFVCCRQSLAGRMKAFAPLSRNRIRRGMNEQVSAWLNSIEGLPAVHERLRRVAILNRDALDCIRSQDGEQTLFYCDPPYLMGTRAAPDVYDCEMTDSQHFDLLSLLLEVKGKVMLSGYRSEMYDTLLAKWRRVDFDIPNNAAGSEQKRRMTECVWCNF